MAFRSGPLHEVSRKPDAICPPRLNMVRRVREQFLNPWGMTTLKQTVNEWTNLSGKIAQKVSLPRNARCNGFIVSHDSD
jgi:hypothetical protein